MTNKDYKDAKNKGSIIHWLPIEKGLIKVNLLLQNGKMINGLGEKIIISVNVKFW